jgi:hypothetical protein
MSMKPSEDRDIPVETRKVAQAAFPKGNVYLWLRDELGELYKDELFADHYSPRGQPTVPPRSPGAGVSHAIHGGSIGPAGGGCGACSD